VRSRLARLRLNKLIGFQGEMAWFLKSQKLQKVFVKIILYFHFRIPAIDGRHSFKN
jgi:hypothetical protein